VEQFSPHTEKKCLILRIKTQENVQIVLLLLSRGTKDPRSQKQKKEKGEETVLKTLRDEKKEKSAAYKQGEIDDVCRCLLKKEMRDPEEEKNSNLPDRDGINLPAAKEGLLTVRKEASMPSCIRGMRGGREREELVSKEHLSTDVRDLDHLAGRGKILPSLKKR